MLQNVMDFEWDPGNDKINKETHGISFSTAKFVFNNDERWERYDSSHSENEDRWQTIGMVDKVLCNHRQNSCLWKQYRHRPDLPWQIPGIGRPARNCQALFGRRKASFRVGVCKRRYCSGRHKLRLRLQQGTCCHCPKINWGWRGYRQVICPDIL